MKDKDKVIFKKRCATIGGSVFMCGDFGVIDYILGSIVHVKSNDNMVTFTNLTNLNEAIEIIDCADCDECKYRFRCLTE